MAQEPDLLISAGFSAAQVAKEADKLVALYRDRGEQAGKAFKDATGKVTDAEGLRAHMRNFQKDLRDVASAKGAALAKRVAEDY